MPQVQTGRLYPNVKLGAGLFYIEMNQPSSKTMITLQRLLGRKKKKKALIRRWNCSGAGKVTCRDNAQMSTSGHIVAATEFSGDSC